MGLRVIPRYGIEIDFEEGFGWACAHAWELQAEAVAAYKRSGLSAKMFVQQCAFSNRNRRFYSWQPRGLPTIHLGLPD